MVAMASFPSILICFMTCFLGMYFHNTQCPPAKKKTKKNQKNWLYLYHGYLDHVEQRLRLEAANRHCLDTVECLKTATLAKGTKCHARWSPQHRTVSNWGVREGFESYLCWFYKKSLHFLICDLYASKVWYTKLSIAD